MSADAVGCEDYSRCPHCPHYERGDTCCGCGATKLPAVAAEELLAPWLAMYRYPIVLERTGAGERIIESAIDRYLRHRQERELGQ